jgi:hypothetical protein
MRKMGIYLLSYVFVQSARESGYIWWLSNLWPAFEFMAPSYNSSMRIWYFWANGYAMSMTVVCTSLPSLSTGPVFIVPNAGDESDFEQIVLVTNHWSPSLWIYANVIFNNLTRLFFLTDACAKYFEHAVD